MAINVKELKDDAIINIQVNKTYYMMVKGLLYYVFNSLGTDDEKKHLSLEHVAKEDYMDLTDYEKSLYTITLLLAEIEKKAKDDNLYDDKKILEPGDEGYVDPMKD